MAQVIVAGGGALSNDKKVSANVKPFSVSSLSAQRIINFHVVYNKFLSHVSEELNKNPKADVIDTFVAEFCSSFISKAQDVSWIPVWLNLNNLRILLKCLKFFIGPAG